MSRLSHLSLFVVASLWLLPAFTSAQDKAVEDQQKSAEDRKKLENERRKLEEERKKLEQERKKSQDEKKVKEQKEWFSPSPKFTRAIVGIDLSGASSQATRSDAFAEFNLMAALGSGHRHWVFVNPRILTVPQQTSDLLTKVTTTNPSFNSLLTTQFNQIIQSFDVLTGYDLDFKTAKIPDTATGQDTAISIGFAVAAGFATPLTVQSQNVQQFSLPSNLSTTQLTQIFGSNIPTVCMSPSSTNCISTVAFVPPDRTRFFKQYYAGFRLKSYYYGLDDSWTGLCKQQATSDATSETKPKFCEIFPGTVDVMVGQNAAVSGGNLHGLILRTEVFYPLWFNPAFHLFFTGLLHMDRHHEVASELPVVLDPATGTIDPTKVQSVPLGTINRDFYRVGMGIDLVKLYDHYAKERQNKSAGNKAGS